MEKEKKEIETPNVNYWEEKNNVTFKSDEVTEPLYVIVTNAKTRKKEKILLNDYINSFDDLNAAKNDINEVQKIANALVYEVDKYINESNITNIKDVSTDVETQKTKLDELNDYVEDNKEELTKKGVK